MLVFCLLFVINQKKKLSSTPIFLLQVKICVENYKNIALGVIHSLKWDRVFVLWDKVVYNITKWEEVVKLSLRKNYVNRRIHTHIRRKEQNVIAR